MTKLSFYSISTRRMRWSLLENDALKRVGQNSVTKEYAKLRDLALLTVDQLRKFWVRFSLKNPS